MSDPGAAASPTLGHRRVPPGQTLTDKWPLLHVGPVPEVDLATWNFRVFGEVERPLSWSHSELMAQPSVELIADIHCVTGWSRLDDGWTGVPIRHLLESVVPRPGAGYVIAHCEHGYTTSLPLDVLDRDDVLLCYGWNRRPLSPDHGWPLRLLVPKRYFWKSAKWLRGLEFAGVNRLGFWEKRGYHDQADPWKEQRFW